MTAFTPTGSLMPKSLPETDTSTKPAPLTKEELAELFASPDSASELDTELELDSPLKTGAASPKRSSFNYKQYQLFHTPKLSVYWQGVIPDVCLTSLFNAQSQAKIRIIGSTANLTSDELIALSRAQALLGELVSRGQLFTPEGKATQLETVNLLIQAGVLVKAELTLSLAKATERFEEYQTDLANYLIEQGFDSADALLAKRNPTPKTNLTITDLPDLADF